MIELTIDGEKHLINQQLVREIDGSSFVYFSNDEYISAKESYEEIKALLRQQRVNELAEKLWLQYPELNESDVFIEAVAFMNELEKRNNAAKAEI